MSNKTKAEKTEKKRIRFDWLYTNKALAVISVILAITCWVMITLYVSDDSKTVVTDVPILIDTEDLEEFHELQLISITSPESFVDSKVDVEISGSIYEISRVTAEDITITAQLSNVTSAGEHLLQLTVSCSGHDVTARIKDGHNFIRVWFDRIQQKRIPTDKVIVNGVSTSSDDLIIGDYYSSIKSLTVQGPESVVEKIASIRVTANVEMTLSKSEKTPGVISYHDAEGNEIPADETKWITVIDYNDIGTLEGSTMAGEPAAENITVTIPIRKQAELAISVPIRNVPEGFDVSSLKYSVTPRTITLEGDVDAIDKLTAAGTYSVEGIDMSALYIGGRTMTFPLNLSSGIEELSGRTEVTVTFDISHYSARHYTVENNGSFGITGIEGVKASVLTDSIEFIVIGPKSQMNELDESSFTVMADMSTYDGTSGQRKMPAIIRIKGADRCWVYGSYTLTVSPEG